MTYRVALHVTKKQGSIHNIRFVLILHYAIFCNFYKSVTDGPTDGWTNGQTDTPSYRDARKLMFINPSCGWLPSRFPALPKDRFPHQSKRTSWIFSRVQRDSICHFVGPSVCRSVCWSRLCFFGGFKHFESF